MLVGKVSWLWFMEECGVEDLMRIEGRERACGKDPLYIEVRSKL